MPRIRQEVTGTNYITGSGFISRSPRLMIRELDDLPGSYSTTRRTGDTTRTGVLTSSFSDKTTIIFSESGNVVFPAMLPRGSSFISQAVDIVGQESDISASLPIKSYQQPNHLHYSPTETIGPFNEDSKDLDLSSFYLTGTSESTVPGLSGKIASKTIVNFRFSNNENHYVTRYSSLKGDALDPTGLFAGRDVTGFCYFNPSRGSWEDKGSVDVATGISRDFSTCVSYEKIAGSIGNTSYNAPFQFSWSPNVYIAGSTIPSATYGTLGYESVGHPTILGEAPHYGSVYHATASQVFSISDKISSPFLLEKLTVSMKVGLFHGGSPNLRDMENYTVFLYRQSRRGSTEVDGTTDISTSKRYLIASASVCVIDTAACSALPLHSPNFSVRLPVNGSTTREVRLEMTPSVVSPGLKATSRLIGSCSFYNGGGAAYPVGSSLFNLGGWPYKLPLPGAPGTGFNDPSNPGPAPVLLQNFWAGGRTYSSRNTHGSYQYFQGAYGLSGTLLPPTYTTHTGLNAAVTPLGISNLDRRRENFIFTNDERDARNLTGAGLSFDDDFDPTVSGSLTKTLLDYDQVDRAFPPSAYRYIPSSIDESTVYESPYLLLPGDELVLGIDAGIPADKYYEGNETSAFESPASYMLLPPGDININMYGSLIKDGKYVESTLNQDLSSNSIHEIIGAEPQFDQFQISPVSSYYGSYLDDIVTGSMATPLSDGVTFSTTNQDQSRRVISRVSLGQAGITGSLQRFLKLSDAKERTYDSCLPSYADFLNGSTNIDVQLYNNQVFNISNFEKISIDWLDFERDLLERGGFLANQFPFQFDPERNVNIPRGFIQIDRYGGPEETNSRIYATDDDRTAERFGLLITRDLIFRTRYLYREFWLNVDPDGFYNFGHKIGSGSNATVSTPADPLPRNEKAGTYRYGISNIEPEFTSARWRPDHYGYFRDMLEPRQHVVTVGGAKPIKIRFVSGSNVIYNPTDTHTQNLSTFATSSMPFFDDGIARNRSDNPDETLLSV